MILIFIGICLGDMNRIVYKVVCLVYIFGVGNVYEVVVF